MTQSEFETWNIPRVWGANDLNMCIRQELCRRHLWKLCDPNVKLSCIQELVHIGLRGKVTCICGTFARRSVIADRDYEWGDFAGAATFRAHSFITLHRCAKRRVRRSDDILLTVVISYCDTLVCVKITVCHFTKIFGVAPNYPNFY